MKKSLFIFILLTIALSAGFAQTADVVYIDGWVDLKRAGKVLEEALIGDVVRIGDSVLTGEDGRAELTRQGASRILISPNTIFLLSETVKAGEKQTVLSCVLGAVSMRFDRMTEKEPIITSPSISAGVRGTEFTVFTAPDGTTLVAVESGLVDVEASGATVSLSAEEGVEVRPGEPPGEKFKVLRGQIDYSGWSAEKMESFLEDPSGALDRLNLRMKEYAARIEEYKGLEARLRQAAVIERDRLAGIKAEKGEAAMLDHYKTIVQPLDEQTAFSILNQRFYALSALSLRRYIMTSLYVTMKTRYLPDPSSGIYSSFLDKYNKLLALYEEGVVPHLVEADM